MQLSVQPDYYGYRGMGDPCHVRAVMPGAYLKPAYILLSDGHWPGSLVACLVTRSSASHRSSQSCRVCCHCIHLKSSLLSLSFTATLRSGSSPSYSLSQLLLSCLLKYTSAWTFHHREIFECAYLKFTVSGRSKQTNQQTSIDTHTCAQCSHASVGLAQARPNY